MFSNENLEKVLLTTAITGFDISNTRYIIDNLEENDFYSLAHKEIFNGVVACIHEQDSITFEMVDRFISSDAAKNIYYGLLDNSSVTKVEPVVEKLKAVTKGRFLAIASHGIIERLTSSLDVALTIDDIESELFQVFQRSIAGEKWINFNKQHMQEYLEDFQKKMQESMSPGLPMGMPSITRVTGGARGGEVVVIAGRPGMGKSSYALTTIVNHLVAGYKPALFSLEMGKIQITNKLVSMVSDSMNDAIRYYNLRNPYGQKAILRSMGEVIKAGLLTNGNFNLNVDSGISFNQVKSYARELKYQGRLDSLFVDHIGLMVKDKKMERQELSQITGDAKKLATELDIPVFLVSQLSRSGVDKPTLHTLKGSGTIEEDADIVLFPWRQFAIDPKDNDPEEAETTVAKARDSETGTIKTHFSTETTFFREVRQSNNGNDYLVDFNGDGIGTTLGDTDLEQEDMF